MIGISLIRPSFFCRLSVVVLTITLGLLSLTEHSVAEQFDRIEVVGTRRVDPEAALSQAGLSQVGLSNLAARGGKTDVTDAQVSAAIRTLYKTGFFSQVTAVSEQEGGERVLRLRVVEKPQVRKIFITGNEAVEEDDLSEVFKVGLDRFLDRTRITFMIRNAQSYYQSKGYLDATFDYSVTPVDDNQVDITFTVNEGARYKIRSVEFRGLKKMDEDALAEAVQTKRYRWWSSWMTGTGRLNREMLENDKSLARQALLDYGFLEASLSEPRVEASDGDVRVVFDVDEGRQFSIGEIRTSGDSLDSGKNPLEGIESLAGEVFSASKARADAFKISDAFSDEGYAFANVVPETAVNREQALVNLDYRVNRGKRVSVDQIRIKGNDKTYDNVIRRELKLAEQDEFSGTKLKRSQQLLERLGYFDEVSITTAPAQRDDKVDLLVNVKEGQTGRFSIGAGFSSADGLLFNSRLSEANVFGTGRSATIDVDLGTERSNINLSVSDPRINDSYWAGTVSALRSFRQYTDFDRVLTGGSVEVGYPLEEVLGESFEDISFSMQYQFLDVEIRDVEDDAAQFVRDSKGNSTTSSFTPRLTRNTVNNPLDPKSGSRQSLSFEYAGPGGDNEFWVGEAKNIFYQPLFETGAGAFVFSMRTSFSYGEAKDDDRLPLYRRFFPGGINSVRGYKNRRLGPKDENGKQFGGAREFVNNAEIIVPLVKSAGIKGVFFYDVGQAFDDGKSIDFGELRKGWGYGLRWSSPLGPIRLEFGYPISKEEGESGVVTMFAFGAPF